jgi:hypothetical protein
MPEPWGKNNTPNQGFQKGCFSRWENLSGDWWLLGYVIATVGNGLLPMVERTHEVEANNRTR